VCIPICHTGDPEGHAALVYINRSGIWVDSHGSNMIIIDKGANLETDWETVYAANRDALDRASLFLFQSELEADKLRTIVKKASECPGTVLWNPAPYMGGLSDLLPHCDIVAPNENEFVQLYNESQAGVSPPLTVDVIVSCTAEEMHKYCSVLGVRTVIVTLGKHGCHVSVFPKDTEGAEASNLYTRVPALSGVTAVDTTGAGDAFIGGFAACFVETASSDASSDTAWYERVVEAARFGCVTAGLQVQLPGTAQAMPTRHRIEAERERQRQME
ncbi:ribokinase, partial [Kipferlia bialata]